jgi:hypothetical protein
MDGRIELNVCTEKDKINKKSDNFHQILRTKNMDSTIFNENLSIFCGLLNGLPFRIYLHDCSVHKFNSRIG